MNRLTICLRANIVIRAVKTTKHAVYVMISLKKRFAKGTLLEPIEFPIRAQVASWMPSITMDRVAKTLMLIV